MNFNNVITMLSEGKTDIAVDTFYDVLAQDDNACFEIPAQINYNPVFAEKLTDVFNEKWNDPRLGIHSRIMLLNGYILQKRWKSFEEDDGILLKLKMLDREAPNDQGLMLAYVNFCYLAGFYFPALRFIYQAEKMFSHQTMASFVPVKIRCLRHLGMDGNVEKIFATLSDDFRTAELLVEEAKWRRERGEYTLGVDAAREALIIDSENVDALFELGSNLYFSGEVQAAKKGCFEPLISMADINPVARYYSLFAHIYMGDTPAALDKVGSGLQDNTPDAWFAAAEILALLEDFNMACNCLEKARKLGFVSGVAKLRSDYAFRTLRDTEQGKAQIDKFKCYPFDQVMRVSRRGKVGELIATFVPELQRFTTQCRLGDYVNSDVLVSTGSLQTMASGIDIIKAGLLDLATVTKLSLTAKHKGYNPAVGSVWTFPLNVVSTGNVPNIYTIKDEIMVSSALGLPGGVVLGLDRLGALKSFTLECDKSNESSAATHEMDFRFDCGFYVIQAFIDSQTGYNSESFEVGFVIDTICTVSYISRSQIEEILTDDGVFPIYKKQIGGETRDVIKCNLNLCGFTLENVELAIVEGFFCGHIGFDVLCRFKRINIDNSKMKVNFSL